MDNGWVNFTFNRAVREYGNWVTGKLNERDKKGKPVHKLEDLLKDGIVIETIEQKNAAGIQALRAMAMSDPGIGYKP